MSQTISSLEPGESRQLITNYVVKAEDFVTGTSIVNRVTAEGIDPQGNLVTDEDSVEVKIVPLPIKIPNAFTPNGDGINDTFTIEGIEAYDRVEVLIFNRWGNEVYKSERYNNDWAGLNLHDGVYYYMIRTHKGGVVTPLSGWVVLKRN